jgi:hypothetical protein
LEYSSFNLLFQPRIVLHFFCLLGNKDKRAETPTPVLYYIFF